MPVVFIHGVNTRGGNDFANGVSSPAGDAYGQALTARNELIKRLILAPLGSRYANMEIVSPYWGDLGAHFRWNQASLPDVHTLEHLGAEPASTFQSDLALFTTVNELATANQVGSGQLEHLGAVQDQRKRAAQADLLRFLEAVLAPVILDEQSLAGAVHGPEQAGLAEALLAITAQEVAADPQIQQAVAAAPDDEAVMELLKTAMQQHFKALLTPTPLAAGSTSASSQVEMLGAADWFGGLRDQVGELFDRAKDAPLRLATVPALDMFRQGLQNTMGPFLGDVFVYLLKRGDAKHPGPIVQTVLDAIHNAPKQAADEPLIIITHSMGGNILYDILSYYAPDLHVDGWIAVASQAGQFEEMKLFQASDPAVGAPNKLPTLKPRLGYWLNVYDPADIFSYLSSPIFASVDEDLPFLTGAGAPASHSAYFKRPSFYTTVHDRLARVLS